MQPQKNAKAAVQLMHAQRETPPRFDVENGETTVSRYTYVHDDEPTERGDRLTIGQKGSGKTNAGEFEMQMFHNLGYKVESTDAHRRENVFYGFPENNEKLIRLLSTFGREAKGFDNEVWVPQYSDDWNTKLSVPETWRTYKIFFGDLTMTDLFGFIPEATQMTQNMIKALLRERHMGKIKSLEEMVLVVTELLDEKATFGVQLGKKFIPTGNKRTYESIAARLSELYEMDIVSSEKSECIDYADRMNRPEVIDSYTYFNCDDRLATWLYAHRLNHHFLLRKEHKFPNMINHSPEAHYWAPYDKKFNPYAEGSRSTLPAILKFLTQGRDLRYYLAFDTQRIMQMHIKTAASFSLYRIFRVPTEDLVWIDKNIVPFPTEYKERIMKETPLLKIGHCLKIWNFGSDFRVDLNMPPSMSFHKLENMEINEKFVQEGVAIKDIVNQKSDNLKFVINRGEYTLEEIEEQDDFGGLDL